ncbi:hypothetical protein GCM10020366_04280 [Saccharopolyspora gregorii]|uniref:Erythromycin biosynthesis protein CIII-like C-terminal domain-containing protein n=1 Tax=Saccharopolyspora gregorii TaxID=33914 RepID=A0ABP6RIQ2_9PSEU
MGAAGGAAGARGPGGAPRRQRNDAGRARGRVAAAILAAGADQFGNAETITTAGGGEQLLGAEVTAESVRTAAAALLGDSPHRRVARRVAAEIAEMPSPERVAERLPDFAR